MHQPILDSAAAAPMLRNIEAWCAVNSGSRNLAGLATTAGLLADAFAALPGEIALVDAVPVETVTTGGAVETVQHGRNMQLRVRPQAPVQLLLTGHMDTVFAPGDGFDTVGWRKDGVLGGPGVADMKGGLAVMLAALQALEASPLAMRLGYEVIVNSDEEVGSPGSAPLIARAAQGKRAALTYEPAMTPEGMLAGARPGSGNFSFRITGRAAHAGRNPQDGRNAILAAADLALRLSAPRAPGLSVNPARIDGGGPNNVVPAHAVLRVNLRPRGAEDLARAQALIARETAAVASAHDVRIDAHGGFARPPKPLDPAGERLFELVRECGAALGQEIGWGPSGGVCDGNNIAASGVPVVDTMGVRGGAIHSHDEYLITASLPERAMLSTLVLLRLAEGA